MSHTSPAGIAEVSYAELPGALPQLDVALAEPGAFRLVDMPDTGGLVGRMHAVTTELFELPSETKELLRYPLDQYIGWCGGDYLSLYGSRDRKEMFHIGPRVAPTLGAHDCKGSVGEVEDGIVGRARQTCALWPDLPEFVEVWHLYYRFMQQVSARLGRAMAKILEVSEAEWLSTMAGNWADLAANYYAPIRPEETDGDEPPVYNAAHRDLTVFTILHQDDNRTGALAIGASDGSWVDVEPVPGTFVVNVGELLTFLSGGRWRAAPHQVTVPPGATAPGPARISIPFFYRPSDERIVSSFADPQSEPVAVGQWVLDRKRGAGAAAP